jgi:hypothetical protein
MSRLLLRTAVILMPLSASAVAGCYGRPPLDEAMLISACIQRNQTRRNLVPQPSQQRKPISVRSRRFAVNSEVELEKRNPLWRPFVPSPRFHL